MSAALSSREARKAEALESFRVRGMPHRRFEHWRYSDLRAVLDAGQVAAAGTAHWHVARLPEGVELFDLSGAELPDWVSENLGAIGNRPTMGEASLAFAEGGVALRVPRGVHVAEPLPLQITGAGNLRVLVVLEDGASLTLAENHAMDAGLLRNIGVEFAVGTGAVLTHIRLSPPSPKSFIIEHIAATVAREGRYRAHYVNFGSRLSRTELHLVLEEEGAEAEVSGVSVLGHEVHADVTTHVEHAAGKTRSSQLFKYIAGGHARAVYQGKITVREGANGSDSRQTAKGLLMSGRAEIDLKPELIIFADDVKCAHGAAVGDLDADSLFYLRSRGVPEREARRLLVRAFLEEAVAGIDSETMRAAVWQEIESALPRALEAAR